MNEAISCTQCVTTNPPDALFCEWCGAPISAVTQDASLQSSKLTASPQPRRRFNRRYAVYAVVGIIVIASIASLPWILPHSDYTSQITDYFQKQSWTIVKPFQRTTLYGADAYAGSAISVGNASHNSLPYNIEVFPSTSVVAAQNFEKTLAHQFWSQGFIEMSSTPGSSWSVFEMSSTPGSSWFGVSNDSVVGMGVVEGNNSPTGAPAVLVMLK